MDKKKLKVKKVLKSKLELVVQFLNHLVMLKLAEMIIPVVLVNIFNFGLIEAQEK